MRYQVTYTTEAATPEEVAQKTMVGFYLSDTEVTNLKIEQVNGTEVFSYPFTQSVIRQLSEEGTVKRRKDVAVPPAEGEWNIAADAENHIGDDL